MKIDIDGARAHLPFPPKPLPSSQRYEKPSTSSNSLFGSTMTAFPFGTSQNLSSTYRARTRQGLEYGQLRDFESRPYDSENFFAHQNPVTSLMQHHQKYRTFHPGNPVPTVKEKVPLTKFTFDIRQENKITGSVDKFESLIENRKSNRISTTGSLSARFVQPNSRVSTRANTDSDYGVPFKETIPMKRARFLQRPLENVSEVRRDTRQLGLKTEESFGSDYSAGDIADLDAKIAKTFRLKKDITTKYKSDIQTKEIEKKHISVKKLTNEELIMQNKDKIMVCVDNEDITDTLKYCFVSRNIIRDSGTKITKTGVEFNIKLDEIVKKLKVSTKYKYLYLLNGTPVFELSHIPRNENVIIISQQIELRSADDIIEDDLVKDFYEYGTNKDIMIYSRSHVRSRMASVAQIQQMVEEKYNDVLELFDGGEQLDSAELGRILKTEDSKRNKEFSGTISKFFSDKAAKAMEEESPAKARLSKRFSTLDYNRENMNTYEEKQVGNVVQGEEEESEEEDEKTKMVKIYLKDRQPLSENRKLDMYQQINRQYKGELRKIKIGQEETEGNEDFEEEVIEQGEEGQRFSQEGNVGENLDILLKKWKNPRKKLEYFDIRKEIGGTRKDVSNHTRSRLQDELVINQYDNLIDAPTLREKGMAKNFILDNKKNLQKKKGDILKLSKLNKELFLKNIPKNIEDKNLSRRELHYIYILYKALCEVTSQRHKEYKMGDGIDYHSFKNGIHQVFIQSDEVAEKIFYNIDCNFSGFLNWEEFIDAMVVIRAKTMRDKIDLFIKIADEDGNGSLSKDEIFNLAKICLKKFVTGGDETFLDNLCEYFTKLIFSSVDIDMSEEIPLQSIKQAIISGNPESDLLAMFCGADI